jgi:hypothetical protein
MAPFEELQELWQNQQPPAAHVPDGTALARELQRYGRKRNLINIVKSVAVLAQIFWLIARLRGSPPALLGAVWISAAEVVFIVLDWRRQWAIANLNFPEPSLGFVKHATARLREDGRLFRKHFAIVIFNVAAGMNLISLGTLHGSLVHRVTGHIEDTAVVLVAWRVGIWLRAKRVEVERRPLIAQLRAMERAFKEGL